MAPRSAVRLLLLVAAQRGASGAVEEMYTQNAICRMNLCTNPLFPGLHDMPRLEKWNWQCQPSSVTSEYMPFCREAVIYDSALPSPNDTSAPLSLVVKAQDDAASTMFFFHLNGLGYEAWEHPEPHKSNDACVRQTWRMVCFTYFPKSDAGCQAGALTQYRRPCASCCSEYLQACQVECCDESPQCVFEHQADLGGGSSVLQTGYVDAMAPSALCTGMSGSRRLEAPLALLLGLLGLQFLAQGGGGGDRGAAGSPPRRRSGAAAAARQEPAGWSRALLSGLLAARSAERWLVMGSLAVMAVCLQGCTGDIPRHSVGNWRSKQDYLVAYEFIPPGGTSQSATLNSCSPDLGVSETVQCSGRGFCKAWNAQAATGSIAFCSCDRDYADPECRTRRKSQTTVFLYSLFGGLLGLDYFYLGLPLWGTAKLCTFGGLGYWWLVDIIRTGSGNVYAHDFRVAPDLPHWVYVISVVTLFLIVGFVVALWSYLRSRKQKRQNMMMLQESEESRRISGPEELRKAGPQFNGPPGTQSFASPRSFSGYGATLPVSMPNADAPFAQMLPLGQVGPYAGPYGPVAGPYGSAMGPHGQR